MKRLATATGSLFILAIAALTGLPRLELGAAEPAPAEATPAKAEFAAKPKVERDGQAWKISFAAAAPTDATVSVISPEGKVVRHLAAGLLGNKAPEPFKAGLAQSLAWDGLDDAGKPVPAGGSVRVALGLGLEFARILCPAPTGVASRGPIGIAVDRGGNLYVTEGSLFVASVTTIVTMKAFDSEGRYLKTVVPFRADCPPEKISMVDFITTVDGRRVPLSGPHNHRPYTGYVPGNPGMTRHLPAITKDGRMYFGSRGAGRVLCVGIDGSCPRDLYNGPRLPMTGGTVFLALSPDDKFLYVSGIGGSKKGALQAVYRAGLGGKEDAAKLFLGTEGEAGNDEKHFKDPRGIAVDSAGRIYVADYYNDRIQVFDSEGKFLKSLEVPAPEQVQIHPKTGAVYVLSVRDRGATDHYGNEVTWEVYGDKGILKYASLDDWKKVAEIDLPKRKRHMHDVGPIMTLDSSREEPALWIANVGRQEPEDMLWKVADRGGKLEKVEHQVLRLNRYQTISPPLAADRKNNELYAFGTPEGNVRIDPDTGQVKKLELAGEAGKAALEKAGAAAVGPDGSLYLRSSNPVEKAEHAWLIRRFNRKGELVPFEAAGEFIETNGRRQGGSPEYVAPFSVGPDGKMYVVGMASKKDFVCRVDLFGSDGKLAKAGLVEMTANPGGVRVDSAGRLYVSDTLRPKDRAFPDFFPADPRAHLGKWYGTVFRFPAEGGSAKAAPADAATHFARGNAPARVEGALWGFYGISPMPQQAGCLCVIADFDADGWGRLWVPDAPGCCVAVLDSGGNVLTRFGAYGNRDALGTGSAVPQPAIPLWSPERVAALDADAFVVDSHNCRIVQVRLKNAAEESVPLP